MIADSVAASPPGRRARQHLPVRRARLEPRHRAGGSHQPADRRLHHQLPGRGPEASRRCPTTSRYAQHRRPAATASTCTRSRSRPTWSSMLPRMVAPPRRADRRPRRHQHLPDLPRGPRGRRQGPAVGHGRRRALRRLPQALRLPAGARATARLPAAVRDRAIRPVRSDGCRSSSGRPRPALGRAGPSASCPSPTSPRSAAFRRSYTHLRPDELADLLDPSLMAPHVDRLFDEHAAHLRLDRLRRPRQPHVHDRRAAVPDRPQPDLHRPLERWPLRPRCASRTSTSRWPRPRSGPRAPREDQRPRAQGHPEEGGRAGPPRGDHLPAQGPVQRPAAGLGPARPGRDGRRPAARRRARQRRTSCAEPPWSGSSPTTGPAPPTGRRRSGTCSPSRSGCARLRTRHSRSLPEAPTCKPHIDPLRN